MKPLSGSLTSTYPILTSNLTHNEKMLDSFYKGLQKMLVSDVVDVLDRRHERIIDYVLSFNESYDDRNKTFTLTWTAKTASEIPRESVEWFATRMEAKLKANEHKGGWNKCSFDYLISRAKEELAELEASYKNNYDNVDHTIDECADVANIVHMIADLLRR